MRYIDYWVHVEKTPISQKEIVIEMQKRKEIKVTIIRALIDLTKLGYIRREITNGRGEDGVGAEKTRYVQLRRI